MQTLDLDLQLAPQFVEETPTSPWSFFIDRKIDAFLASTPLPLVRRDKPIWRKKGGHGQPLPQG